MADKKRPAVVVSSSVYNRSKPDIVVMAITSQVRSTPILGEVWLAEWKAAGLLKPSVVKPVFATIERGLIIRRLGRLHSSDQRMLGDAIASTIGLAGC